MISVINSFPDFPRYRQTVDIDGLQVQVRKTFRGRTNSWYIDMYELDDTPIVLGKRMSAGWDPTYGLAYNGPLPGIFYVKGKDDYSQFDLGSSLFLWFIPTLDLFVISPPASTSGDPVVVIA